MSFGTASPDAGVELLRQLFLQCVVLFICTYFVAGTHFIRVDIFEQGAAGEKINAPCQFKYDPAQEEALRVERKNGFL